MSNTLRAIIVDDEDLARQELRTLLGAHTDVEVVGEAATVAKAVDLIRSTAADVAFLDIQLVGETGFALIGATPPDLEIVFVTAHAEHAVRAFDVRACDYLLKPVEPDRLAETVQRLREPDHSSRPPLASDDRVFLRVINPRGNSHHQLVPVGDIACILADGDNSRLAMRDGAEWAVPKALHEWESRLPPGQFARVHRSAIVNLAFVERIEEWSHYAYRLWIANRERPVMLSRRYAQRLRERGV